jgi:hypothetical protein
MKNVLRTMLTASAVTAIGLSVAGDAEAQRRGARRAPEVKAQAPAAVPAIDLDTPAGVMMANRRIWCTMTDGEPVYWHWRGEAFSRRQGEKDRMLFKVEGLNVRTCAKMNDPARGGDYVRSVSRELLLFIDPVTNQVLSKWTNPWTNEVVDVLHVANDPVNGDFTSVSRDGQPSKWRANMIGDQWFLVSTAPLFFENPLGGAFQSEIGGAYHATEMFSFSGLTSALTDSARNNVEVAVAWSRMSDWLPWMKMGGREGLVYFHTAGRKLTKWDDVSPLVRGEIDRNYPLYRNPPPIDDRRPNETSWSYFKKVREGQIQPPKR